jgi:hypothetical protein
MHVWNYAAGRFEADPEGQLAARMLFFHFCLNWAPTDTLMNLVIDPHLGQDDGIFRGTHLKMPAASKIADFEVGGRPGVESIQQAVIAYACPAEQVPLRGASLSTSCPCWWKCTRSRILGVLSAVQCRTEGWQGVLHSLES